MNRLRFSRRAQIEFTVSRNFRLAESKTSCVGALKKKKTIHHTNGGLLYAFSICTTALLKPHMGRSGTPFIYTITGLPLMSCRKMSRLQPLVLAMSESHLDHCRTCVHSRVLIGCLIPFQTPFTQQVQQLSESIITSGSPPSPG